MVALLLGSIGKECANTRQLPRRRRGAKALPPPVGKEGAKVGGGEVEQARVGNFLAAIVTEELDQPVRGSDIGADGVRRAAPVVLEIGGPLRRQRLGRVN